MNRKPKSFLGAGGLLGCLACLALPGLVSAAYIRVNVSTSTGLVSAFTNAENNPGNFYELTLAPGTYRPATKLRLTKGRVRIYGDNFNPGARVVDGQAKFTVMEVYGASGYRPYLELNGIMLRNGSGIDGIGYIGGGGLRALRGDVYVSHCIIRKNQANLWGAGVYAQEATLQIYSSLVDSNTNTQTDCGGGLTSTAGGVGFNNSNTSIANTTVKANKACRGGGVAYGGYGNFTMENSTLSGNVAKARGGGLFLQYGTGSVVLRFNTIAFNTAGASGTSEWRYGGGFGMFNFSGNLESYGNIIAKNTVTYTDRNHLVWYDGHDCYADGGSVAASTIKYLYNMVGIIDNCSYYLGSSGSGWAGAPMDPRLQPLATAGRDNYGFALPVHMPYYYSPVVNGYAPQGGANQNCPNYDERGFFRPHANDAQPYCDQGAAEYNGFTQ